MTTTNNTQTEENQISESVNSKILIAYFSVPETTEPDNMTTDEENSTVITNGFSLSRTRMETAPTEVDSWLREINVIS